jgi:hypothetical protein
MRNPMTFDALWRANLAQEQRRTDTPNGQEMPGTQTVVEKDTKDLELADEGRKKEIGVAYSRRAPPPPLVT